MINKAGGNPKMCIKCYRYTYGINSKGECSKCNPNGDKEEELIEMTNKEKLLNLFDEAFEKAGKDSCIIVTVRTRVACTDYNELIVLTRDTWAFKKDYYSKAYNDDLVLNNAEFVSILSVSLVDNVGIMNIKRMELFNNVN